jgi:hypothetical protein
LAITPTTAAVIAARAEPMRASACSRSIQGAPSSTSAKLGRNVVHVVSAAPAIAAASRASGALAFHAAMNPTYCSPRMSGPGVVSASASPSSICAGDSQPRSRTACSAT